MKDLIRYRWALLPTVVVVALLSVAPASAALNVLDPGIIVLYKLDEQTSGQLINNPIPFVPAFTDSAVTGTPQNHDGFGDSPSDGPAWAAGSDFEVGGTAVGTGGGLLFDAGGWDRTRATGWMDPNQGNYDRGGSFTIMVRAYLTEAIDGVVYDLFASGWSNYLVFEGTSKGTGNVLCRLRGSNDGPFWSLSSDGNNFFDCEQNTWYNIFLIYNQNTSVILAADDGTTFASRTDTSIPVGFDTSTGFGDGGNAWCIGAKYPVGSASYFDGRMESIVVWDHALSLAEADAVNFTNVEIPSDCDAVIDMGYRLSGDLNGDCRVDLVDASMLAAAWLESNDPAE